MASTNASPGMTIWHPDILNTICDHLETPAIKALRLVEYDISKIATPYLFRTLVLGLRQSRFTRLRWVAERQEFAKGVREVVWETAHYHDHREYDEDFLHSEWRPVGPKELQWSTEPVVRARQEQHVLARYQKLAREEEQLLESDLVETLRVAFEKFPRLTSVAVMTWTEPLGAEGRLFKHDDFGYPDYEPPPFRGADLPIPDHDKRPTRELMTILEAFASAGRQLRCLRVKNCELDVVKAFKRTNRFRPFMSLALGRIDQNLLLRLSHSLQSLRTLHLIFNNVPHDWHMVGTQDGGMRRFIANLPQLEDLCLCLKEVYGFSRDDSDGLWRCTSIPLSDVFGNVVLKQLKRLSLHHFWLESDELCDVVARHRSSLEDLYLYTITLGEIRDAQREQGRYDGPALASMREKRPAKGVVSKPWDQVAETCQKLPKLRGLTIMWAYEGFEQKHLGLSSALKLADVGMNGRENSHSRKQDEYRQEASERLAKYAQDEA